MKRSRDAQRSDNQMDHVRVLEVRIHLPPAESRTNFRYLSGGALEQEPEQPGSPPTPRTSPYRDRRRAPTRPGAWVPLSYCAGRRIFSALSITGLLIRI